MVCVTANAATNEIIVVSASRINAQTQSTLDVPTDITEITREQIEASQANSLPDLLSSEGNLLIRSSNGKGNTGEISMRGFGENSGLRVLVIVDEQKMNRSDMGIMDWQQLPLDDIESVEILRGGQSVLYGNHALSGVVKITTRKGGEPELAVSTSAGSYGFENYTLHTGGETERLFFDAGYTYQRDDGYRDHSSSWSRNVNASLSADLNDSDTLTIRLAAGNNYYQLPGSLTYEQFQSNPEQSTSDGDQFTHTDNALVTALWEGDRDWGNLQLNTGLNWRDIDWEMDGISGRNKQFGYSFSPKIYRGTPEASVSSGFDLFLDTLDFEGERTLTVNNAQFSRLTIGPFLHTQKMLTDTFTLSGGSRFEFSHTAGENRQYKKSDMEPFLTNPFGGVIANPDYPAQPDPDASFDESIEKHGWAAECSLNWQPADTLSVWCGYDRVYRYPALDETASYQGFPLADPMNENLDPETGDNFEFGAKLIRGGWSAATTFFYLMLDDEISYDDTEKLNINIGRTQRTGADFELGFQQENAGISCRTEWVRAVFDGGEYDGATIPLVPALHSTLSAWVQPLQALKLKAIFSWIGEQYQGGDFDNNSRRIKEYGLFDLHADFQCSQQTRLFIKAENLFDKKYASSAYNGGFYPGSGRAVYGGIRLTF